MWSSPHFLGRLRGFINYQLNNSYQIHHLKVQTNTLTKIDHLILELLLEKLYNRWAAKH